MTVDASHYAYRSSRTLYYPYDISYGSNSHLFQSQLRISVAMKLHYKQTSHDGVVLPSKIADCARRKDAQPWSSLKSLRLPRVVVALVCASTLFCFLQYNVDPYRRHSRHLLLLPEGPEYFDEAKGDLASLEFPSKKENEAKRRIVVKEIDRTAKRATQLQEKRSDTRSKMKHEFPAPKNIVKSEKAITEKVITTKPLRLSITKRAKDEVS